MKMCCSIFIFMFCLLCSSCVNTSVMEAQNINYYDRYYYGGYSYPVIFVSSVPYYYINYKWIVIPHSHYCHIRHYRYPMSIRGTIPPSYRRYHYREHYPRYRKYERPHNYRHSYRINQRPSRGRK